MSVKNSTVIQCWARGESSNNDRSSLHTDGTLLYSYRLPIGHRTNDGTLVVADYMASSGSFQSQTTSQHVGLAKRVADQVWHPEVWARTIFDD